MYLADMLRHDSAVALSESEALVMGGYVVFARRLRHALSDWGAEATVAEATPGT
jgi:hypothetical protein